MLTFSVFSRVLQKIIGFIGLTSYGKLRVEMVKLWTIFVWFGRTKVKVTLFAELVEAVKLDGLHRIPSNISLCISAVYITISTVCFNILKYCETI